MTDLESADPFQQLARALRTRLEIIADREFYQCDPAGHLQKLQEASTEIDALEHKLPRPLDPDLAHYIQKHSYDKALAWIEGNVANTSEP